MTTDKVAQRIKRMSRGYVDVKTDATTVTATFDYEQDAEKAFKRIDGVDSELEYPCAANGWAKSVLTVTI